MICFYHSADLDGHCSGAIVKYKYPDCEMIGYNYGDEFPWDKIVDQDVIMVDVCLQPFTEHMPRLAEKAESLVWIDHHITEIEEHNKWSYSDPLRNNMEARLDEEFSACELAWGYFFETTMPKAVKLLGRYDIWDHAYSKEVMPFQWGMRVFDDTYPDNQSLWESLFLDSDLFNTDSIIERGRLILRYRDSENAKYIRACVFNVEFEGLKFVCINRGLTNSQIFDTVWDEEKYDGMLTFVWRKGSWSVSMYGTKGIDLGAIAKKHGGGGHKQACGFQCDELPFRIK